jgi:hypothetical protein
MEKEFIPYEQALALKELGFESPYPIGGYQGGKVFYYEKGELYYDGRPMYSSDAHSGQLLAPLYQQAFRWFREKYNLVHEISWGKYKGGVSFDYDIFSLVLPTDDELGNEDDIYIEKPMETYDSLAEKSFRDRESDTFEEAELACLKKLIEIVKQK